MFKNINNGTSIKTILTLFLLIKGFQLCSQNDREIRKHFTMAEHFFELKNYKKTIEHVLEIDKQPKTPLNENPDFNFIAGTSFWFSDTMKLRAIPHFEDYLKVTKEEVEVIIWLAKLYHMNYQYDKAKQSKDILNMQITLKQMTN